MRIAGPAPQTGFLPDPDLRRAIEGTALHCRRRPFRVRGGFFVPVMLIPVMTVCQLSATLSGMQAGEKS
ncbi:hypothetical protein [Roseovarius salis]|uniref:hypothetical protein n=1 Tax=Roseovarius salis TaxID=3376063 RepID=UPI0037CA15CF